MRWGHEQSPCDWQREAGRKKKNYKMQKSRLFKVFRIKTTLPFYRMHPCACLPSVDTIGYIRCCVLDDLDESGNYKYNEDGCIIWIFDKFVFMLLFVYIYTYIYTHTYTYMYTYYMYVCICKCMYADWDFEVFIWHTWIYADWCMIILQ